LSVGVIVGAELRLPVSQSVCHDDGGGVLLERWDNEGSASHFEDRFMQIYSNAKEGWKRIRDVDFPSILPPRLSPVHRLLDNI